VRLRLLVLNVRACSRAVKARALTWRAPYHDYGLWMQKRKIRGRVPRSFGSDRQRTDGDADDDDEVPGDVAQPPTARASMMSRRTAVGRFMAIF